MTTLRAKSEDPTRHGPSCRGVDNSPTLTFTYEITVTEDWLKNCREYAWVRTEVGLAFTKWCDEMRSRE